MLNQNKKLKNWYVLLGNLRKNPVFANGNLNILTADSAVFGFERLVGKKKVVIYTNVSSEKIAATLVNEFRKTIDVKYTIGIYFSLFIMILMLILVAILFTNITEKRIIW